MAVGIGTNAVRRFDRRLKLAIATFALLICSAGTASAANLDTSTYDFGNQNIGSASAAKTITLNVSGGFCIPIPGGPCFPEILGPAIAVSGPFTQTNNCPLTMFAISSCTIDVTFTPTSAGPQTGTLSVADVGPANQTVPGVDLRGTGVDPSAASSTPTSAQTTAISNTPTLKPPKPKKKCKKANNRASASKKKCGKKKNGGGK